MIRAILSGAAALAAASPAQALTVRVFNLRSAHIASHSLGELEAATASAANGAFRAAWHTRAIHFVNSGVGQANLILRGDSWRLCDGYWACHYQDPGGKPTAVASGADLMDTSIGVSHEVLELLADQTVKRRIAGNLVEVCDPVNGDWFQVGGDPATAGEGLSGVAISDYVLPAFYHRGSRGPWDATGIIHAALAPDRVAGGFQP